MTEKTHRQKLADSRHRVKQAWSYRLVLQAAIQIGTPARKAWINDLRFAPTFNTGDDARASVERFASRLLARPMGEHRITLQTRRGFVLEAYTVPFEPQWCGTGRRHIHPLGEHCPSLATEVPCAGCALGLAEREGVHYTPVRAVMVCERVKWGQASFRGTPGAP